MALDNSSPLTVAQASQKVRHPWAKLAQLCSCWKGSRTGKGEHLQQTQVSLSSIWIRTRTSRSRLTPTPRLYISLNSNAHNINTSKTHLCSTTLLLCAVTAPVSQTSTMHSLPPEQPPAPPSRAQPAQGWEHRHYKEGWYFKRGDNRAMTLWFLVSRKGKQLVPFM